MPLHGLHPLGIDHPAAEHPPGFVLQIADAGAGRVAAVPKKLAGAAPGEGTDGGDHTAVILHIVVAVKYIVFPVVLVLGGDDDLAEAGTELAAGGDPEILAGIGVAPPGGVHLGQVVDGLPVALVQHAQDAGAVGPRLAAENAEQGRVAHAFGASAGLAIAGAAAAAPFLILSDVLDDIVVVRRFLLRRRQRHRLVNQVNQIGESVPEKAADTHRDINARAAQLRQRNDLQVGHPPAFRLPHGFDAQQVQDLGNIVPVRPHCRSAPDHHAHHFRVGPFLVQVLLQQGVAEGLADIPGGGRGQGARVHRVKIAARGQDIDHPPRGRPGRAGRHKTALQPPQQVVNFVGRPQQGRVNILPHIRENAFGAPVGLPQQIGHHRRDAVAGESLGAELLVGAAAQGFQRLNDIAGVAYGRRVVGIAQRRRRAAVDRRRRVFQQGIVIVPQRFGQGAPQAGHGAVVQPRQGAKQAHHLLGGRRLPQGMQAVLDLGILDFAEVAVDFQHKLAKIVGLFVNPQVAMQLGLLRHFPDLGFQRGQFGRIQGLALVMFVHQLLQPGDVAVGVSGGHRGYQVVNNGGVGAALGLGAFAGVVDDERVEQGNVVQRHFGVAGLRQPHALARQPFQRAVLADVDHRIGPEHIPQPAVVGDIVMGWRQIGVVIDGDGVFAKAARGLQAHEYIAHRHAGNGQPVAGPINLARPIAPRFLQLRPHRRGKAGIPSAVIPPFHMAGGQAQLLISERVGVIAAPLNNPVHQFVAVGGNIVNGVSSVPQGVENADGRGRRVQPDGVADAGVFGGIVAQYDGNALVGVGLPAQNGVAGRQPRQVVHPVGHCHIALHPPGGEAIAVGRRFLFERHRHGDNAPVKLRESHIHRRVNRPQPQGAVRPFRPAAHTDDALYYRHVQPLQQFLRPAGGHGGAAAALLVVQVAHRQPHRIDDAVHPRHPGGVNHIFGEGMAARRPVIVLRAVLEAVGENGQDIDLLRFQRRNQVVNERQVAAHPVGAVEQGAHGGASGDEPGGNVFRNPRPGGNLRMVNPLPGHRRRRLVAVIGTQVGIGQKEKQVAEINHAAAHQVRENGFHFRHRRGAGGDQILVPFLVAGAGNQRYAPGAAQLHQRVKGVPQGALAPQQPQNDHAGAGHGPQQPGAGGGGVIARARQRRRIDGVHADGIAPGHIGQRAFRRQQISVGGGDQRNAGRRGGCGGSHSHRSVALAGGTGEHHYGQVAELIGQGGAFGQSAVPAGFAGQRQPLEHRYRMFRVGAGGNGAGGNGRRHIVIRAGQQDDIAPPLRQRVHQFAQLGTPIPALVQRKEQRFLQRYAGAGAGDLNAADAGYQLHGAGPAAHPVEQLLGGYIQVAPHADHAGFALLRLLLGIVQHGLLVAVGHRAHFGVPRAPGDNIEDGLETDHQIGAGQRLPALEGQQVGVAGADGHYGHFEVSGGHCVARQKAGSGRSGGQAGCSSGGKGTGNGVKTKPRRIGLGITPGSQDVP